MNIWAWIIIILAIGIILSNIMLLKKTANMKIPQSAIDKAAADRKREAEAAEKEKNEDKPS